MLILVEFEVFTKISSLSILTHSCLVILGICVYVVPDGERRKVKHLRVFFVTAAWSMFAYIWLYLIISVVSPGEVEVWEAVLTFLFFPLCVVQAWIADRRLLFYKYARKRYRTEKGRGIIVSEGGEEVGKDAGFTKMDMLEIDGITTHLDGVLGGESGLGERDQEDEARRDMARTLKELKQRHPDKDMEQLIEMANYQVKTKVTHLNIFAVKKISSSLKIA